MAGHVFKSISCFLLIAILWGRDNYASDCLAFDSGYQNTNYSGFKQLIARSSVIDQNCFYEILKDFCTADVDMVHLDSLTLFVKKWFGSHHLGTDILLKCYRNDKIYKKYPLWQSVFSGWYQSDESIDKQIAALLRSAKYLKVDTLFMVLDAEGKLGFNEWLRWAKVKSITGDNNRIAGLFCRALQKEPGVSDAVLDQFGQILWDMKVDTADKVLHEFYRCSITKSESDTLSVLSWIADAYSKFGLYQKEIDILNSMQKSGFQVAYRLLDAARLRFNIHKYKESIQAARMCYQSTDRIALKSMAAAIIYKSYIKLDEGDSASMWIGRADPGSNIENRIDAITFYQNKGEFLKAAKQIDSLPLSLIKDTFAIRQYLFKADAQGAFNYLNNNKLNLKKDVKNLILWKIRTSLFCGKIDEAVLCLDTFKIEPYWESAGELIWYKYWIQLFENSPEALAVWAKIEYNLYIGNFQKIMEILEKKEIPSEYIWQLGLNASKKCLKTGQFNDALQLLKFGASAAVPPEFLYYKAEALFQSGKKDSAQYLFNKIILEHSEDSFSEKARIFVLENGL